MILIVDKDCPFCEEFKGLAEVVIAKVVGGNRRGVYIEIDGQLMPCPVQLQGLPTLVDGKDIYIGAAPIRERLEKMRSAACLV